MSRAFLIHYRHRRYHRRRDSDFGLSPGGAREKIHEKYAKLATICCPQQGSHWTLPWSKLRLLPTPAAINNSVQARVRFQGKNY